MNKSRRSSRQNIGTRLITQLTVLFMLIFAALILLTSFVTYGQVRKVIERQSEQLTQRNMRQTEQNFLAYAEELNRELLLLSEVTGVQSYLEKGWVEDVNVILRAKTVFDEVSGLMRYFPEIKSVFYFAENGTVIGETRLQNLIYKERDFSQTYYGSKIQEAVMAEPWTSHWFGTYTSADFLEEDPEPYFTVARSINRNGHHFATVVINLEASRVRNFFISPSDTEQEYYLADEVGVIIAAQSEADFGTQMELSGVKERMGTDGYTSETLDKVQMNYHKIGNIAGLRWMFVSKIPLRVLYSELSTLKNWFIGSVLMAMLVGFLVARYFLYRITKPLDELRLAMGSLQEGNLGGQLEQKNKSELGRLGDQFNAMSLSIDRLVTRVRVIEKEKRTLEQDALQAQITPHFLFNTLTNIKYMAMAVRADGIVECITALGNFLRPIYQTSEREWTIPEEFRYLQNYIVIMNYRFGGKIRMNLSSAEDISQGHFPKFILQPVLENAISHGFEEREGEGEINVKVLHRGEGGRRIIVRDNGRGMDEEELGALRESLERVEPYEEREGSRHIGLRNVHRRLQVYYGTAYGVQIYSKKGEGTEVWVDIL